jgi:hypothetical protein
MRDTTAEPSPSTTFVSHASPVVPPLTAEQVEYFNAPYHHRPSAGPGMALGAIGLGLVLLGGCFMIGLLIMHQNTDTDWSGVSAYIYVAVLYACVAACFAGAVFFLALATKSLLKAARG